MSKQVDKIRKELKEFIEKAMEIDPVADEKAREKLITARIAMLLRLPFYGNIATRLRLKNADLWCPTMATDGKYLYYNSKFVNEIPDKQLIFAVAHEVLHIVYDTLGRENDRDSRLWNIASDFTINRDLREANVGEFITYVEILYDPKYKDMISEEIYDELYQQIQQLQQSGKGDSKGNGNGSGQSQSAEDGQSGQGEQQSSSGAGGGRPEDMSDKDINDALDGMLDKLLDDHLNDGDSGNGGDKEGKGGPEKMTAEERRALRDELREAILAAAEQAQMAGAGNLPGGVERMIKELTEPKIDWRELLEQQIQSIIKSDYSWNKPSRKSWHTGAVLPGNTPGETIDVTIAIDTSGSISAKMLKDFFSEIQGIMDQYTEYKIKVWCFDTEVHNPQDFSSENMESITEYEPAGFGGTDFEVNWTFMKQEDIEPHKLIVFTDGYPFGSWGDENYCDTVWIINGGTDIVPPFGTYAYYEHMDD